MSRASAPTNRRAFIGSLALGTFARAARRPRPARAQGLSDRDPRSMGRRPTWSGPSRQNPYTSALLRGLRELGYVYGEHFVTEPRGAEGRPERFPSLAAELVRLQVDVIVAAGPALPALKQATSTIPIVMTAASDPVSSGYRPEPRTPGRELHGAEPSGDRDDGEATRAAQGARPGSGAGGGPLGSAESPVLAGGRSRRPGARVEAGVDRDSTRGRDRGGLQARRPTLGPALSSCSRPRSSSRKPGDSRSWPPGAGSRPCTSSGRMSRPAG